MLFIFTIGYRLAFFALAVLTLAAAIPLAFAWARILPDEPLLFEIEPVSQRPSATQSLQEAPPSSRRDPLAIILLVIVTLNYVIQFPGVPRHAALDWLNVLLPSVGPARLFLGVQSLFALTNAGASCYAILRRNFLRVPLAAGAALVLVLCLVGPYLRAALLATS